jgi:uncharacterized metal-binding protein YceD (DUF177 family)
MSTETPWSHEIEVGSLPQHGRSFELVPDPATRKRLADHAGVVSIPELKIIVEVKPTSLGVDVTGVLTGVVRQNCVVSVEEFDNPISEQIEVDFANDTGDAAPGDDEEDLDLPDPILDGKIDLGALAAEFLVLAIDPYPRKPGAELPNLPAEKAENDGEKSPFERLAGLKDRIKK